MPLLFALLLLLVVLSLLSEPASKPRGGERGESTVNVGGNCGEDRRFIDSGLEKPRLLPIGDEPFRGESVRPLGGLGRCSLCRLADATPQGDCGRGRSKDARPAT